MQDSTVDLLDAAVSALGGARRAGQVRMAEAVTTALEKERHLAVQAGTGTGKSLAYLVPAFRHAQETGHTVIVSTATLALQRQLVERDLPRLAEALEPYLEKKPTFAIMKGRSNYVCLNKVSRAAELDDEDALLDQDAISSLGRHVQRVYEWAEDTETGDREDLEPGVPDLAWRQVSVTSNECLGATRCPHGEDCFAELARRRAADVDIVVTNHALLAIDAVADINILPEHDVVIIDEAHELDGRITLAEGYLAPLQSAGVDTLVLGCTHYPLLTGVIQLAIGDNVTLVSSAEETTKDVLRILTKTDMLAPAGQVPTRSFECTGDHAAFERLATRFLGPKI